MKKHLALLYGGKSVEHEISIRSAKNVANVIDTDKYELLLVGITKNGQWFLCENLDQPIAQGKEIGITLSNKTIHLTGYFGSLKVDIAFPLLHGTDGEDGSVQGFFKMLDIPVVGSDVTGSAIAMDKILSKQLWQSAGIPVAPFRAFRRDQLHLINFDELAQQLGLPFMLKAGNLGSSVGVNKVKDRESFDLALKDCIAYSHEILAESFIKGRELECALLGNTSVKSTVPGEIILRKDYEFYTYEAKYEDEDAITIDLPAKVTSVTSDKIRKVCEEAYKVTRCRDYARVDLFLTESGEIIVNEINTIPGFTNVSMFPMLWRQMGLEYPQLIQSIIDLAVERWEEDRRLNTSFRN